MGRVRGTGKVHTQFWCNKLKESLEDLGLDETIISKLILNIQFGTA
jgi:hypothetical protein